MSNTLISVEMAAERLGIGRTKAYELIKTGRLRSVRLDGRRLIPADAIDEFIAGLGA